MAALIVEYADDLRRVLVGVLRDHHLANDVLQTAIVRAIDKAGQVPLESLKGWLYRVAINEAILFKRKLGVARRANEILGRRGKRRTSTPETNLVRWETVVAVRRAIEQLPVEQRQVVRMRIYEDKKFAQIAAELNLPLGTVLTRMQSAQIKLRKALDRPE